MDASPPARLRVAHDSYSRDGFTCQVPREVFIETSAGCANSDEYPTCKWRVPVPSAAGQLYRIWRLTTSDHREARPALVSLAIAAAADYSRLYPGEVLALGDMDAPGPRHETHNHGVDMDIYLPGAMQSENSGEGDYTDNYDGKTALEVRNRRARVEQLARIFATCTDGRVRIYYNDPPLHQRFIAWFTARGFDSPFGSAMMEHNDSHRFHFHVTIPPDLPVLPHAPDPDPPDLRRSASR